MSNLSTARLMAEADGAALVKAEAAPSTLETAFAALASYQAGSSRAALLPLDEAVRACLTDAAERDKLERRLMAALNLELSPVAKEYLCGKLGLIGSAASVPVLAELLADPGLSQAARNALEALPCPQAGQALRASLSKLEALPKIGVINSIGARRDLEAVPALAQLLKDANPRIAGAAAAALGRIGTPGAAQVLLQFLPNAPQAIQGEAADACLASAERLLTDGNKSQALAIYQALLDSTQPKPVQASATRGRSRAAASS